MIYNFKEGLKQAKELQKKKSFGLIICINDDLGVCTGLESENYNEEELNKTDCFVLRANYHGGTTVVSPGDLSILIYNPDASLIGQDCLMIISDYLKQKGILTRIVGNDLLLYKDTSGIGYKVGSWSEGTIKNKDWQAYEVCIHFTINVNLDLISKICTKSMNKIPAQLSDYNITAEELLEKLMENNTLALSC